MNTPIEGRVSVLNWIGALVSVGLIVGLAVWGYKLAVRDVSGVPVVRALDGPMRTQPESPGGRQASHQGFAVNQVQAQGQAAATADTLILAPAPIDLIDADAPVQTENRVAATAPEPSDDDAAVLASVPADAEEITDVQTLAEQIAASVTPLTELAETPVDDGKIAASVPGVAKSPRPKPRPDIDLAAQAAAAAQNVSGPADQFEEIDPASIPPGTRLVQFGAFDTADLARAEWETLSTAFGDYLTGKTRVVQEATSGGRTFYRLRAMGFADLNDARRFCSVLLVKDAACIPVEVR